ncbi:MAG: hypothetical protein R3C45_08875, partial [Phycisphaerales bacterium]
MWEIYRHIPSREVFTLWAALSAIATHTYADIEYNTAILLNAPKPAYDTSQARPALRLNKPAIGSINSLGQLAGMGDAGSNLLPKDTRPFFYDPAQHTAANLGDLTGDFAFQSVSPRNDLSKATDLNDAGWVVGLSSTSTTIGVTDDRPFLWFDDDANHANTPGEMRQLNLNPGAAYGSALRVNNNNQVLIHGDTGLYRASFSLGAGVLTETTTRSFIAPAADIADMNDLGNVAYTAGSAAYVWRDLNNNNTADVNETTQIPFMSAVSPNAAVYAINNAGQVAGTMRNDNAREIGFIWTDLDNDNTVDFTDANGNGFFEWNETSNEVLRFSGAGGLNTSIGNTFVFDINDHGTAIGGYFNGSDRKAFVHDTLTGIRYLDDLVDPAFTLNLREADAINNAGVISAVGRAPGVDTNQLVLLTPPATPIDGDLDGDGFVGINDLNLVLGNWNQTTPPGATQGDPSGDGFVGIEDLNTVLGNWNAGTPPGDAQRSVPEPGGLAMFFS